MRHAAERGSPSGRVGVLNAGVVLGRLVRERRSHEKIVALFKSCVDGRLQLWMEDASLADRFAVATADVLKARLHTTDRALAQTLRKRRRSVTCF